ncbi:MAG: ribosome biogenesis GTPase Der, partial [Plesiomonas sp.]
KPTLVVANKVDGLDGDAHSAEFYALGLGNVYQIAAAHGRGVSALIDLALAPLAAELEEEQDADLLDEENDGWAEPEGLEFDENGDLIETDEPEEEIKPDDRPIKIALVGRPNVGKSTLTNRILGEDRVVVYDMPGTTRDSIYIPMERDGREYVVIDTAGVRRRGKVTETVEKFSVIKTLQAIEDANVVLLVLDARMGISDQDLSLLGFVLNAGRSLVVVVNKWDGLDPSVKDRVKEELDRRMDFVDFARIHFISALHGSGVGNLFDSIQEAYTSATKRVTTSLLTRIMQMAVQDHQPPMVNGRRIKLKYAHTGGHNPPIIVIHGNQLKDLSDSYKRYLMNYYRRSLKIMGTPIRIQFQESENPFSQKRNLLSVTQMQKRKRLMKFIKQGKK